MKVSIIVNCHNEKTLGRVFMKVLKNKRIKIMRLFFF